MGVLDWNWAAPCEYQDYAWDCAAASTAWALQAAGLPYSEDDVIKGLGPSRISPTYGLLDASGAGLVQWLGEIGVTAQNNPNASFSDCLAAAGYQPMVIGGRTWNHWSGVRMGGPAFGRPDVFALALANPSPGWMEVTQWLDQPTFAYLGPFSAVWFTSW